MKGTEILERIIFVGGPPRSGTTFAAKSLNLHPSVMAAIDDHVYECWGLYYYRDRVGLVQELRTRQISPVEVKNNLRNHLFRDNRLIGAAPSAKTTGCPEISIIDSPYPGSVRSLKDSNLVRYSFPLDQFSNEWYLCLKSPEISYVLPQLADHFPTAKFVLVYRPIIEIAESMYRLGDRVKRFPVFHERWKQEKGENGELLPPPGVPTEWYALWQKATDFQRCVIYTASYIQAIVDGTSVLPPHRFLVYNHAQLRNQPENIFKKLAQFLDIEVSGFQPALPHLQIHTPPIPLHLEEELKEVAEKLELNRLVQKIEAFL
jgi:hypothetical protein